MIKPTFICPQCGRSFQRWPSQMKEHSCCSHKCANLFKTGKQTKRHSLKMPSTEQLLEEFHSGLSVRQIAAKHGVSFPGVRYHLVLAGATFKKFSPFSDPEFRKKIKAKQLANCARGKNHSRYKDLPMEQIAREYADGALTSDLGRKYGVKPTTIIYKLREVGATIKRPPHQKICKDGHIAESNLEFITDNWLFEHGVPHEVHPVLPWSKFKQADFLVDGVYIEVWGMVRHEVYAKRKAVKLSQYKQFGFQVISIYPADIEAGRLDNILRPFVSES